jgi:LmbE family N-acetylglucosaminyl deacetylase
MRRDSIDLVVDITEEVEAKDELVQLYASQQSSMNYVAMSRHLAAYRSAMFGAAGYAECFDVKKVVVDRW